MSDTSHTPTGDDELELVEVETEDVGEDGNVVVDDVVTVVDSHGNIIATDETIAELTADGNIVVDETFSVADEDGGLHVIDEVVTVLETEDGE